MYPGKLQIQYDTFLSNENVIAIWHKLDRYDEDGSIIYKNKVHSKKYNINIYLEDILSFGSLGGASSLMYKKLFYPSTKISYDFDLAIEILLNGKGLLITDSLGAYRVNSKNSLSISSISDKLNYGRVSQLNSYIEFSKKNNINYFYVGVYSMYSTFIILLKNEKMNFKLFYFFIHLFSFKILTKLPSLIYKRIKILKS
jgi:hypothetical protein